MIDHVEIWASIVFIALMLFEMRYKIAKRMDKLEKKIDEIFSVITIEKKAKLK